MAGGVDAGEAAKLIGIGAVVGAVGFYLMGKLNIGIGLAPAPQTQQTVLTPYQTGTVPTTIPGATTGVPQATTFYASAYPAFGHDPSASEDRYNNSEVWDTRDRKYFLDNILFNKLPHIPRTSQTDFNPQFLPFAQAYDHNTDQDSPRPRFGTHMLDRIISDEHLPRRTALPYYF